MEPIDGVMIPTLEPIDGVTIPTLEPIDGGHHARSSTNSSTWPADDEKSPCFAEKDQHTHPLPWDPQDPAVSYSRDAPAKQGG